MHRPVFFQADDGLLVFERIEPRRSENRAAPRQDAGYRGPRQLNTIVFDQAEPTVSDSQDID